MDRYSLGFLVLLLATPAEATTYFNAPVNTLTDGATATAAAVNGNFTGQITDGNAAIATIQALISGLGPVGMPTGAVIMINNASCPAGYTVANGGSGSPDARGVYIRGTGGSAAARGVLQLDQFQSHTHAGAGYLVSIFNNGNLWQAGSGIVWASTLSTSVNTTGLMNGGGAPGSETKPDSVILLHCYKT